MAPLCRGEKIWPTLRKKKSRKISLTEDFQRSFFCVFFSVAVGLFFKFTRDATWRVVTAEATSAHAFAVF